MGVGQSSPSRGPCAWVECSVGTILKLLILSLGMCFASEVQRGQWSLCQGFGASADAPSCFPPHPSHRFLLCSLPPGPSKLPPRHCPVTTAALWLGQPSNCGRWGPGPWCREAQSRVHVPQGIWGRGQGRKGSALG